MYVVLMLNVISKFFFFYIVKLFKRDSNHLTPNDVLYILSLKICLNRIITRKPFRNIIYQILYYIMYCFIYLHYFSVLSMSRLFFSSVVRVLPDCLSSIIICKMNKCQLESELHFFLIHLPI